MKRLALTVLMAFALESAAAGQPPRTPELPPVAIVVPPAQRCVNQPGRTTVYFEFERAAATPIITDSVKAAVARARSGGCLITSARIEGHDDQAPSESVAIQRSADRAEVVKQMLIANGVAPDVIETEAFGSSRPVLGNRGEREALNRRAELQFTIGP